MKEIINEFLQQIQPEYPRKLSVEYSKGEPLGSAIPMKMADLFPEAIPMGMADKYPDPIPMTEENSHENPNIQEMKEWSCVNQISFNKINQ